MAGLLVRALPEQGPFALLQRPGLPAARPRLVQIPEEQPSGFTALSRTKAVYCEGTAAKEMPSAARTAHTEPSPGDQHLPWPASPRPHIPKQVPLKTKDLKSWLFAFEGGQKTKIQTKQVLADSISNTSVDNRVPQRRRASPCHLCMLRLRVAGLSPGSTGKNAQKLPMALTSDSTETGRYVAIQGSRETQGPDAAQDEL